MKSQVKSSVTPQILVVEDEQGMRDVLKLMVSGWGYTPVEASNVKDALARISNRHIDLMLLDLHLGGADGRDLLRVLQRRQWRVPTLVVSAFITSSVTRELAELGVQGIVAKPFSKSRLASEIQRVLQLA